MNGRWHSRIFGLAMLAALLWSANLLTGCATEIPQGPSPGTPSISKGQTSFTTDDQNGDNGDYGGGRASGDAGANAAPQASPGGASNDSAKAAPGAPSGRTGTVEEADLYRVKGNLLFYLNTYKGLVIFDMKNPKKPKKLSNLPVFGYPIEMFVENNIAYALVRDALYMVKVKGKFEFQRRNVSQLVSIDISNPNAPRVLQRLDIQGQLREGVSRKIEDTVYVVSYRSRNYWWGWSYNRKNDQKDQVTVYSYNVSNPRQIREVQNLQLLKNLPAPNRPSDYRNYTYEGFSGVTISATSNTLLVGEKWYYSHYSNTGGDYRCSQYENYQYTWMNVVDISDPKGNIRVHTRFKIRGLLTDQFKQTYIFNKAKQQGIYLGIFQRNESKRANCKYTRTVKNTLISIDISNGASPKVLNELQFGKPNEQVRGSLFDNERKVVYAITAIRTDPLYALSFENPSKLKIMSAVDGLSGDINLFRFIGKKKFLLAVGRDNSKTCTGFEDNGNNRRWFSTRLAVSIIDVRALNKVRLVQRKCVYVENARWSSSAINWNLDQAHKMIGMYSDSKVNLLTVPVNYYSKTNESGRWWYEYKSAVGMMKWDLSKYDETKDEKQQKVLENVATVLHPKGSVRRTIIFQLPKEDGTKQRSVLNLSDTHLSLVNIDDIKKPQMMSTVEIAPYIRTVYRFGKYLVEQVQLGQYYDQYNEFRVKLISDTSNINDMPVLASFKSGQISTVMRWKENLILFKRVVKSEDKGRVRYDYNKTNIVIYDLSNPASPKKRGSLVVPYDFYPRYYFYCGGFWRGYYFDYYGNTGSRWVNHGTGFAGLVYNRSSKTIADRQQLVLLNFSNLDKPSYKAHNLPNSEKKFTYTYKRGNGSTRSYSYNYPTKIYNGLVSLDDNTFYLLRRDVLRRQMNNTEGRVNTTYRDYVQPWAKKGSSWSAQPAINLPGRLMRAYRGDKGLPIFLSYDSAYIKRERYTQNKYSGYRYQTVSRLYLLEQVAGKNLARLQSFKTFPSWYLRNMLVDNNRLYLNARRDWYYLQAKKLDWRDRSDHLMFFDLSKKRFDLKLTKATRTYNTRLSGVQNNRLFLTLQGEGLLVADVTKLDAPKGLHFERTLGWASGVEIASDKAFVASGHFGIYQLNLTKSTIPNL